MALEAFLGSNSQSSMPIILSLDGNGGILEALTSPTSLQNEEDLHSILRMAQMNANFDSDVMNSTVCRNSSTSISATDNDAYLQILANFSGNQGNVFYTDDTFYNLHQAKESEVKMQHLENTGCSMDLYMAKVRTCQNSSLKKPIVDVDQEKIHHQQREAIRELLLKELEDFNPQLKEMIEQYRQRNRLQRPIPHPAPHPGGVHLEIPRQQMRNLLQGQVNQHERFAPLPDGGICSRRMKQYLYHLRNNRHVKSYLLHVTIYPLPCMPSNDNNISYWKKFVSEYYAPGSKKRWCFSRYENIELHTAGVFCPKPTETCQICGRKSGKRLEATFEIFPRLFETKYESGMLDEILFLDSPRACKVSRGVILEYKKLVHESVYETFRVIHKGKLRVVLGHDLKILSWEFCIENHDEYLLRTQFTPQLHQLVQAAENYQDIQICASSVPSLQDLREVGDMFVSAGNQIVRNTELPLANDLGYPMRFIRCLQISEVVNSTRDLMTSTCNTNMGPIECLNKYLRGRKTDNQMKGKQAYAGDWNQPTNSDETCLDFVQMAVGCPKLV